MAIKNIRELWTCKCIVKLLKYKPKILGGTSSKYIRTLADQHFGNTFHTMTVSYPAC